MPSDEEIPLSPGDLRSILDAVGERAVLVGGQAVGTAISFEAQGGPTVYVLAPAFLAESRIANLVGLPRYQNTRGLLQARVALEVLREWNRDELDIGWEHARESMERTIRLAVSRRGIRAASLFGMDVLGAIPHEHPALPPAFVEQRYRRAQQTLGRATEAAHAPCRPDKDE